MTYLHALLRRLAALFRRSPSCGLNGCTPERLCDECWAWWANR